MKKLEVNQMENLEAGFNWKCALAIAGVGVGIAGIIASGGTLLAGTGALLSVAGLAESTC